MSLTDEQIRDFLERQIPPEIVSEFVLPIIHHVRATFQNEDDLLRFRPIAHLKFNVAFLAALAWRCEELEARQVGRLISLVSMRDQRDHLTPSTVTAYEQEYSTHGFLKPPIVIDAGATDPHRYFFLDGNHRFKALNNLRVQRHLFWIGASSSP